MTPTFTLASLAPALPEIYLAAAICVVGNFSVLGFGGAGLALGSFLASTGLLIEPSRSAMLGMLAFFCSSSLGLLCEPLFGDCSPFASC